MKHQSNIRTANEFSEKYSENSFLKNLKPMSYSCRVQSMNLHRKSIEWFLFWNITDWKWVTNHEVNGFSNSFQHIKTEKKPCKLTGQIHFCLQLEKEVLKRCFWQNHKGNYGASFNTKKSTYWWMNFFSKSIFLIYFRALLGKLN